MGRRSRAPRVVGVAAAILATVLASGCGKKKQNETQKPPPGPATPVAPPVAEPPPPPRASLTADPGGGKGALVWQARFGGLGRDEPRGLALTKDGGAVVTGIFSGKVDFGPGSLEAQALDVFVIRLSEEGKVEWVTALGGGGEDIAGDVAVDSEGNVIAVGWFSGEMTVGKTQLKSAGADDIYVVKMNAKGEPLWARQLGGQYTDSAWSVAIAPGDDILITGNFRDTVNFGDQPLQSKGVEDIFLARLGPDGATKWSRSFGEIGQDFGRQVAVDSRGDILLAAQFSADVDFGTGKALTAAGNRDIALVKLDPEGKARWAEGFGNSFNDSVLGLALDPADNIVIGGSFEETLKVGDTELKSKGRTDAYVARFDPDGKARWAHSWGADREDSVSAVGCDEHGNVVATGWFVSTVDFGGGERISPNGNQDAFLVKLDASGKHVWSKSFGNRDNDRGRALVVAPDGSSTLAGLYRFDLDLGGPILNSKHAKNAKIAPADVFVVRFGP